MKTNFDTKEKIHAILRIYTLKRSVQAIALRGTNYTTQLIN